VKGLLSVPLPNVKCSLISGAKAAGKLNAGMDMWTTVLMALGARNNIGDGGGVEGFGELGDDVFWFDIAVWVG